MAKQSSLNSFASCGHQSAVKILVEKKYNFFDCDIVNMKTILRRLPIVVANRAGRNVVHREVLYESDAGVLQYSSSTPTACRFVAVLFFFRFLKVLRVSY